MKPTRLLLTLPDYQKVFQVTYTLLKNENANIARACLYFGFIGAAILREHFRLRARPVVGLAAYRLGVSNDVVLFGECVSEGQVHASPNGFHCWVEAEGWVIDFSAPLFPEIFSQMGHAASINRKMFQRRRECLAPTIGELQTAGDALLAEEPYLTDYFSQTQAQYPMNKDLQDTAVQWFRPVPKKIQPQIGVGNQHGNVVPVKLSSLAVSGAW